MKIFPNVKKITSLSLLSLLILCPLGGKKLLAMAPGYSNFGGGAVQGQFNFGQPNFGSNQVSQPSFGQQNCAATSMRFNFDQKTAQNQFNFGQPNFSSNQVSQPSFGQQNCAATSMRFNFDQKTAQNQFNFGQPNFSSNQVSQPSFGQQNCAATSMRFNFDQKTAQNQFNFGQPNFGSNQVSQPSFGQQNCAATSMNFNFGQQNQSSFQPSYNSPNFGNGGFGPIQNTVIQNHINVNIVNNSSNVVQYNMPNKSYDNFSKVSCPVEKKSVKEYFEPQETQDQGMSEMVLRAFIEPIKGGACNASDFERIITARQADVLVYQRGWISLKKFAEIKGISTSTVSNWVDKYADMRNSYDEKTKNNIVRKCCAVSKECNFSKQVYADLTGIPLNTLAKWF